MINDTVDNDERRIRTAFFYGRLPLETLDRNFIRRLKESKDLQVSRKDFDRASFARLNSIHISHEKRFC